METIDKNIPIPNEGLLGKNGLISRLEVGDSIFVSDFDRKESIRHSMKYRKMKSFSRKEGDGYRVWRIR
tara:strand:- start:376 stop:582 length:207 start_codon:yes stop_codon:yes gene_type:complete